ncbi:hypothetical protein QBC40DRAFT_207094 [Triangularia verruculosa]|uniref:Nephrocystin 3-like N-terminal domain-containing protein n=1 Tax=Triangularia verruculosa TaxID=2587418 RepID=A0AAN6XBU9_9PEZI|nr:hypothetical protein QBC40DRAFT_207094 [Triangularia verruculosa]
MPATVARDKIPAIGLTVIWEPEVEATLDVVFVHGFTGHPVRTWSHGKGSEPLDDTSEPPSKARKFNSFSRPHARERPPPDPSSVYWPQDLLPQSLPGARVLTFGYDTNIRHRLGPVLNESTVYDMAKDFLLALEGVRRIDACRPLLFVAHSLGGIMVKEALRQAYNNRNNHLQLKRVFDSTIGIFFFGTPHGGSDPRGLLLKVAEKLIKGIGFQANQHVVDNLLPDSECRQLRNEFNPILQSQDWIIYSFQEGVGMSRLGRKVVENDSSCLNFPKTEITVSIGKDHREMCRFTGAHDVEYHKVTAALDIIAARVSALGPTPASHESQPIAHADSLGEHSIDTLLNSLRFDQIDSRQESIKMAHKNTCNWIVKKREYKDWLDKSKSETHHGFLWMKGNPGSGKSTLMKSTLRSFQRSKNNKETAVIYFFFNARGADLEKSTEGMYRSLLLQLLEKLPHIRKTVFESAGIESWNAREDRTWSVAILEELFERSILSLGQQEVACFIDALDECKDEEVEQMVTLLEGIGEQAVSKGLQFRVFFSSRHYPEISLNTCLNLDLDQQEGHTQDIETYIQSQLKVGNQQTKDQLRERASGVFMWVVLVVEILNKEKRNGTPPALITQKLKKIPQGLYELFRSILTRDQIDSDRLLLCIRWLLFSREPLGPEQFYYALLSGIEDDLDSDDDSPSSNDDICMGDAETATPENIQSYIRNASKGLAEITEAKKTPVVQFIHESVRDFLLKDEKKGLREVWPELDGNFEAQSHEKLKLHCFKYLKREDILATLGIGSKSQLPIASSKEASALREKAATDFPFLGYATTNILWHAECAQNQKLGSVSQAEFLEQEFDLPAWLWLRNLLEKHEVRRYHPTYTAALLYVLAELNLPGLTKISLRASSPLAIVTAGSERYGPPILAAIVLKSQDVYNTFVGFLAASQDISPSTVDNWRSETGVTSTFSTSFEFLKEKRHILSYVAEYGDVALFQLLFALPELGKNVNEKDKKKWSPLAYAANEGHTAIVKFLCGNGAANDLAALTLACKKGHHGIVRMLFETGTYNEARNQLGESLVRAASDGHLAIVKLLLDHGVDVDAKDSKGDTPLMKAVRGAHLDIVKLLLEKGADMKAVDNRGTAVVGMIRMYVGSIKLQQLIELVGVDNIKDWKDDAGRCFLSYAAEEGNIDVIKLLLGTHNVDANSKDSKGQTPLHHLVRSISKERSVECFRLLFDTGDLELDHSDEDGQTPLHLAAKSYGDAALELIKFLLNSGRVEVDRKDNKGRTPLSFAAQCGHVDIVKLLLATDTIQVDTRDQGGRTSMSHSATGDPSARHVLETRKADPNSTDFDGRTPVNSAAGSWPVDVVKPLVATDGVDVNVRDNQGWTPLMYAFRHYYLWWFRGEVFLRTVSMFLNTGRVDIELVNNDGGTVLDVATKSLELFRTAKRKDYNSESCEKAIELLKEYKLKQQTSEISI